MERGLLYFVLVILALMGSAMASACPDTSPLVVDNVHVIDIRTGKVRPHRTLIIENGLISRELDSRSPLPERFSRYDRIEGKDGYVIPGLWDMHVHTLWHEDVPAPFFKAFLAYGVTSVRDMGGDIDLALATRDEIQKCEITGPRLWTAGPFLDGPAPLDPTLSVAIATPEDAREAVLELKEKGVDFLKVYTLLSPEVFTTILNEAEKAGLSVSGHIPAAVGTEDPALLRMASIEHLAIGIGGYCTVNEKKRCSPLLERMTKAGIVHTPTLVVREISTLMASPNFEEPQNMESYPAIVRDYWRGEQTASLARADEQWQTARDSSLAHGRWLVGQLLRHNATILTGSDAGTAYVVPGDSLHQELSYLTAAGLSPLEALQAATINPAQFMGREDLGVVEPGAIADLVLLRANPLEDISNTRTIEAVLQGGKSVGP